MTFSSRDNDSAFNEKLSKVSILPRRRGLQWGERRARRTSGLDSRCGLHSGLDVKWSWLMLQGCKALCCGWFLGEKHGEEQLGSYLFQEEMPNAPKLDFTCWNLLFREHNLTIEVRKTLPWWWDLVHQKQMQRVEGGPFYRPVVDIGC